MSSARRFHPWPRPRCPPRDDQEQSPSWPVSWSTNYFVCFYDREQKGWWILASIWICSALLCTAPSAWRMLPLSTKPDGRFVVGENNYISQAASIASTFPWNILANPRRSYDIVTVCKSEKTPYQLHIPIGNFAWNYLSYSKFLKTVHCNVSALVATSLITLSVFQPFSFEELSHVLSKQKVHSAPGMDLANVLVHHPDSAYTKT